MQKVTMFFSLTILKYWWDLFSLEILKNAWVTSPTHALGGWYIYRQPTIEIFRTGLYRQRLLKFFRAIFLVAGTGTQDTPYNYTYR